ncbi:LOW QUALITY PROTEIN: neoverrucotoxin subunit beta-like [Acipenser ruthenus]|uniref:LOW QUALITY PROTEIN: neoverrucotoxin subunit beta-like n=1 Tax=Acipenser ruthenus TaxID=7906 RepID=UPI002741190D|nr:LOW QUALITY PROTEIN: neoverrucotoxin subunit beta-like [Acipenser ruthenus]
MTAADSSIELATLGRPFQLGMLYDCRSDSLVPGVTLWNLEELQKDIDVRPKPYTDFQIIASDSLEDKTSALNVEASLATSFFSGLVQLKGSAKYLNDKKTSKSQSWVYLHYLTTTHFEQLTMNHLGYSNVTYPNVFKEGPATHVVTAVLYGIQAFFVFDKQVSSEEK